MFSYWESGFEIQRPDFVFIGAGIVGLSAAYHLKQRLPNASVVVLERSMLPNGASTKNAGFACFGSAGELLSDFERMGEEASLNLVEKRLAGLDLLRRTLGEQNIVYQNCGGVEIFRSKAEAEFVLGNLSTLNMLLSNISGKETFAISEHARNMGFAGVHASVFNQYEGAINPMKMMQSWMKLCSDIGVKIYFGAALKSYEKTADGFNLQLEDDYEFNCGQLSFCTNGFSKSFFPELDIEPARAQVLVTEEIPNLKMNSCFHLDEGYFYFRNIGKRILLGGGRNLAFEAENTSAQALNDDIQNALNALLRYCIHPRKELKVEQRWTGIMAVGKEKTYILKENEDGTYIAARLGGMGVAIGTKVGKELAEALG